MNTLREVFLHHNAQTTDFPLLLEFPRAEGVYLFDKKDKPYIDFISGISVSNIGHCHPKVVESIVEQASKYLHQMVYGEYLQSPQILFARELTKLLPSGLQCVYFVNSGAEAVEGAMKCAKRYTGRSEIIACRNSYHGSTQGALSLMGSEIYKQAFRPLLPDVRFINFNNIDDLKTITDRTAAVFVEPIQGEAGVIEAKTEYIQGLRNRCSETGALLVFDEIQTGMGRSGKMFAFEHFSAVPDILLLAKALGSGMPLGAFVSSRDIMHSLKSNPILGHISTFAGHPVCCAAGLAGLEVLIEEKLFLLSAEKGEYLKDRLKHPFIKKIRGKGLMMALEFENFDINKKIIDRCIEQGLITDWFLHCSHSMRIAPPLTISKDQLDNAADIITQSIDHILNKY